MNSLKIHLGIFFPLIIVCFCFQFVFFTDELVKYYESKLNQDYNIVIISEKKLKSEELKHIDFFSELKDLSTDEILNKLKNNISANSLKSLKDKLPNFYSINFTKFLNEQEVGEIKNELLKIPNILKVQTFSKTHNKVYKLLNIIKFLSYVSLVFICVLSTVLFFKQIKIWRYENANRIYILNLFGANFFQRASKMLAVVLIDNLFCTTLLTLFFINFNNFAFIQDYFNYLEIDLPKINFLPNILTIGIYSLLVSLLCVIFVMFGIKK